MIDSSTNNVFEIVDDVCASIDDVSEEEFVIQKPKDEKDIGFPNWFKLNSHEEEKASMIKDVEVKPKKKARDSKKARKRKKLRSEKEEFEKNFVRVSSSNNEKLPKVEEEFALSTTLKKVVFFDPP
jgi:hypothetical protein